MFGGTSQSLLAHRERTANNNPQSVTAQNAFYSALLQAKMAPIIVERYESGQFASNAYTDSLYAKALDQVGGESTSSHASNTINAEQLQALGQAIASSQQRQNAPSRISVRQENAGANDSRLRVVLEETKPTVALRWVKFLAYFVLTGSIVWVVLNLVLEATGVLNVAQAKKAPIAQQQNQTVRFSDVHGCEQAKEELQELGEFLQNPERFNTLGGKLPKGVLLVGPPGTGKTLLARAVAGEAGVPFFYMSGSEFDEVYVGVGARRVRELFNQARGKAPAIIFIDELDAIGSRRNERDAAYVKQTLNQLLTELDGFSQTSGVIILAATNFPQLLDKALTRPGRFDRKVQVPLPDVRGRVGILNHYLKKVPISTDVDVTVIARGTPGFSGAELENLVNQAAIRASRDKKPKVDPKDFDWAKDKIMMGAENRSLVVRDEDKLMTAYHEAGHALVAYFSPRATPLYKVTIVPRGQALGLTHTLPEMDVVSKDFTQYITDIDVCMGGKAAEQLIYGDDKVTSGCASVSFRGPSSLIRFRLFSITVD
jgi:ATP-dependent metalloprotease